MVTSLKPLHDRVVVKPKKQEATRSGLVLPDTASERPQEGTGGAYGSKTTGV
jgi:co-chaperonin GroES (HSP10)